MGHGHIAAGGGSVESNDRTSFSLSLSLTPSRALSLSLIQVRAGAALNRMTGPLLGGESGRDLIQGKDFGGITVLLSCCMYV